MSQFLLTQALRHLPSWLISSVRQKMKKRRYSLVRVLALSALGGAIVLLWVTGFIPYYIREHSLRSYLSGLSDAEGRALVSSAEALIQREIQGKERFTIRVTEENRDSLPPELLKLQPQTIFGGPTSLGFLYDGVGNSETAIYIRNDKKWKIVGHFGVYTNPPVTYFPKE